MSRLFRERDRLLAYAGIVFAASAIGLLWRGGYNPAYFVAIGVLAVVCVAYLLLRDRMPSDAKTTAKRRPWLDIAFLVVFGASILVYVLRPEEYIRPLPYFWLLAVSAGILAAKIWRLPPGRAQTIITLVEVFAIGLSAVWSVSFLYPTIIGLDPWTHYEKTLVVLGGDVRWKGSPFMYLIAAGVMKGTGATYREAVMFVIPPMLVAGNAALIYLIGKMAWNRRAGLLGALMVGVAGWVVFYSFWTIPNAVGLTLSLAVAWVALRRLVVGMRWWVFAGSTTLLMTILVFTHAIATLWALMFIGAFWLFSLRSDQRRGFFVVLLVMVAMVGGWWQWQGYNYRLVTFLEGNFSATRFELTQPVGNNGNATDKSASAASQVLTQSAPVVGPVADSTVQPVPPVLPVDEAPLEVQSVVQPSWETVSGAPVAEMVFNSLGMFLICGLGVLGSVRMLRRGEKACAGSLAVLGGVALAAGFLPMFVGASFLEHRWWLLAEVLLVVPVAVALFGLIPRRGGSLMVGVVVSLLVVLNLLGMPTNMDQRAFSQNLLPRFAFTQAEVDGLITVMANWEGTVGVDAAYAQLSHLLDRSDQLRMRNLTSDLLAGEPAKPGYDLVVIRDEIIDGVIAWGTGTMHRLNYNPRDRLVAAGYEVVFRNEDITVLRNGLDNH